MASTPRTPDPGHAGVPNGGRGEVEDTQSLCPVCLRLLPARRVLADGVVRLVKACPEHGEFAVPIWRGAESWRGWQRPKIPTRPDPLGRPRERGCPWDCGLCPDHRQKTCAVVLEVTLRCGLGCPVCYAGSGPGSGADAPPDPALDELDSWLTEIGRLAPGANLQLSGGEPTEREDLPEIAALARRKGFTYIQLNTNGLALAHEPDLAPRLARAGVNSVFLQFDGLSGRSQISLRGKNLLPEKLRALEACGRAGLGVVLVPTLVPGINDGEVGEILRLAQRLSPAVRGVHFQPLSRFGRHPGGPGDGDRLTLPELMRAIEEQTGGDFPARAFQPPGCENALCSFHASFLLEPGGGVRALGGGGGAVNPGCCPTPIPAGEGARRAMGRVAAQWSAPAAPAASTGSSVESPAQPGAGLGHYTSLDDFIALARARTLSVSAMAFQDAWNLDLERVRDCCIHVWHPGRGLVPFCLFNLTSASGQRLYRP